MTYKSSKESQQDHFVPKRLALWFAVAISVLSLSFPHTGKAIPPSLYGAPKVDSFTPEDYGLEGQCFDVAVNSQGIVYVANAAGVLEFDGNTWTTLSGSENHAVVSLAIDKYDRIWVGGLSEAGVFLQNLNGTLQYNTLEPDLPDSLKETRSYWRIRTDGDSIFFQSPLALLRYIPDHTDPLTGKWDIWPFFDNRSLSLAMPVAGKVWVKRRSNPLEILQNDSFLTVADGNQYSDISFLHALPFTDSSVLLTGYRNGLVLYNYKEGSFQNFPGRVNRFLGESLVFGSTWISSGRIALTSHQDGIIVYTPNGEVLECVGAAEGLPTEVATRCGVLDNADGLWVPLDYGVSRVQLNMPLRTLGAQQGLEGAVLALAVFHGKLYAGTSKDLFVLNDSGKPGSSGRFEAVQGVGRGAHDMLVLDNQLIVGTEAGLVGIDQHGRATNIAGPAGYSIALGTSWDGNYLFWNAELKGIFQYRIKPGRLEYQRRISTDPRYINAFYHDRQNRLWCIVRQGVDASLYRAGYNPASMDSVKLTDIMDEVGLHHPLNGSLVEWQERIWVSDSTGFYGYDSESNQFIPDEKLLGFDLGELESFVSPLVDSFGNLYSSIGNRKVICVNPDASPDNRISYPLAREKVQKILSICENREQHLIHFGIDNGTVITYDAMADTVPVLAPTALIHRVVTSSDSILCGCISAISIPEELPIEWPDHTFRIYWSSPSSDAIGNVEFQFRLRGSSDRWSTWSKEIYHDFNTLAPGKYLFEVRARDLAAEIGEAATLPIRVLPPWYRTPWAWVIWIILGVIAVFLFVNWMLRRERHRREALEKLVRQRTLELEESRQHEKEAEIKATRLATAYTMAATLAHEFNNPLAVISTACYLAQSKSDDPEAQRAMVAKILPQVERMSNLLKDIQQAEELKEIDYASGAKILDIHSDSTKPEKE